MQKILIHDGKRRTTTTTEYNKKSSHLNNKILQFFFLLFLLLLSERIYKHHIRDNKAFKSSKSFVQKKRKQPSGELFQSGKQREKNLKNNSNWNCCAIKHVYMCVKWTFSKKKRKKNFEIKQTSIAHKSYRKVALNKHTDAQLYEKKFPKQ